MLIKKGADVNLRYFKRIKSSRQCYKIGHEKTRLLIEHGANVNLIDQNRSNYLYVVCLRGHNNVEFLNKMLVYVILKDTILSLGLLKMDMTVAPYDL